MQVRHIQPEECILAKKIETIAFLGGADFSTASSEPEKFYNGYENKIAAFNDEGKMCSSLTLTPFEFMFNKHKAGTGGIGGVSSLPEERNHGYVRALLRKALEEMHEKSMLLSYLYPFSHPYYRKFGYELSYTRIENIIPFTVFKSLQNTGKVRFYMPEEDPSDIYNIYNAFIKDKNLAMIRTEGRWNGWLKKDPYKSNNYTFIWYDGLGTPRAYLMAYSEPKEYERADMKVRELVWLDSEALTGLLGFLPTFLPKYDRFYLQVPAYLDTWQLFPEPYEIKQTFQTSGMARIVDAEKILGLSLPQKDAGSLTLEIKDDFLEWNNGIFKIEWDQSGLGVSRKSGTPDLSCSIQVLTQLAIGFKDITDYAFRNDIQIHGNVDTIKSVFPKKPLFINDFF